jgi:hypothetical protein
MTEAILVGHKHTPKLRIAQVVYTYKYDKGKGKFHTRTGHKCPEGERGSRGRALLFL